MSGDKSSAGCCLNDILGVRCNSRIASCPCPCSLFCEAGVDLHLASVDIYLVLVHVPRGRSGSLF
jgi:hypothetical protein